MEWIVQGLACHKRSVSMNDESSFSPLHPLLKKPAQSSKGPGIPTQATPKEANSVCWSQTGLVSVLLGSVCLRGLCRPAM